MTDIAEHDTEIADADEPRRPGIVYVLVAIITICALGIAVAGGVVWGRHSHASSSTERFPGTLSVDAGFARDMTVHHTQAITMAGYERDNTTSPALHILAFDIESGQEFQIGEMQGWLDTWGLSQTSPRRQMAWMQGHSLEPDGLMPGLATPAQMTRLESSHGRALDILFLQLMIHHHQGGIEMAQYAEQNATEPYVRQLASSMYTQQSNEIQQMEQLLRKMGGSPLPPPAD